MVKSLKSFNTYVLHSKIIAYIPIGSIKDLLVQPNSDKRRGQWLAKIKEFDIEVKPTKLVKGQGLTKLLAKSNFKALEINHLQAYRKLPNIEEFDDQTPTTKIQEKISSSASYNNIFSYLLTLQFPSDMPPSNVRTLKFHTVKYCIVDNQLYWKYPLGFLLRCLIESETENVINDFHEGVCGRHHAWRETAYKILRSGYYWPKLFTDMNTKVRACNPYQLFSGKQNLLALPLIPVKTEAPFQQWGRDFIR
jgi:hypothetical protein